MLKSKLTLGCRDVHGQSLVETRHLLFEMVHLGKSNGELFVWDCWLENAVVYLRLVLRLFASTHLWLVWLFKFLVVLRATYRSPCLITNLGSIILDNRLSLNLNCIFFWFEGFDDIIFNFLARFFRFVLYVLGCHALCCCLGSLL